MNLPNKLTILRILMIPVFVVLFYVTAIPINYILSAIVFTLAAATDFLDGYIARKYNMVTDFGKFLDPIADKVLVSTALIVLLGLLHTWYVAICVALIMARELIISGFRLVAAGKGMVIAADKSGKIKTFFTDVTIVVMLVAVQLNVEWLNWTGIAMLGVSALLTIISGVECLVKNRKVISSK